MNKFVFILLSVFFMFTKHAYATHQGCSVTPDRKGFCITQLYPNEMSKISNVSVAFVERKGDHYNYGGTNHIIRRSLARQEYKLPRPVQRHSIKGNHCFKYSNGSSSCLKSQYTGGL